MKIQLRHLVPSSFELIGGLFLTIVIILLANSKKLLNYYDLQSSNDLIKTDAGHTLNHALQTVDSFSATNGVITFLIWAVVGVVCFSLVETMGHAYRELKLERQVGSAQYIHPASFNQASFWRSIMLDMATLVFGLSLLVVACFVCLLVTVPLGEAYSRVFIFDWSVANSLYIVLGVAVVLGGLLLVDIAARFLLFRRKVIKFS